MNDYMVWLPLPTAHKPERVFKHESTWLAYLEVWKKAGFVVSFVGRYTASVKRAS